MSETTANPTTIETQTTPAPTEVGELKATVARQAETLESLNSQLVQLTQVMNRTLETVGKPPAQRVADPETTDDLWKDFEPGAKEAVVQTIESKTANLEDKLFSKWEQRDSLMRRKEQLDSKAVQDFPQLLQDGHPLRQEYLRVYAEKLKEDPDFEKKPSAVYDAANLAYAVLVRSGKIIPTEFSDEIRRLVSVNDSSLMPVNGRPPSRPEEMTKSQSFFARKLGVDTKRYIERAKSRGAH